MAADATHGRGMAIKAGTDVVGRVTDWDRKSSTSKDDCTACGDTSKQFLTGLPEDGGTIKCWWKGSDAGQMALEAAYRAGTPIDIHVSPTGSWTPTTGHEFFGSVMIDSLSTGGGVNSVFVAEFTYVGALLYRAIPAA